MNNSVIIATFAIMETTRQQKIGRLLQKEIATIMQQEQRFKVSNAMITVTKVNITKDLSIARVYLSIFSTTGGKQAVFDHICSHNKELRNFLAIRVKNQLRIIPQLEFFIDDSLDYIETIDRLLKE